MKEIKNVIFDLGGVLVDLDIERCTAAFRELGMPRVADLINPYYPAEMIGRLERGDIPFHEACDEMRRLDGRPEVTDSEIAAAYSAFLVGIPVAKLRQIMRLRAAGVRTYVLSNNNPAAMVAIRGAFTADGHTMDDYFDKIYLSYELHELKPSEAIFRKVIADSGVMPAETLFIDDGRKNVDAAQALGFAVNLPAPGEVFGHLLEEITGCGIARRARGAGTAGPKPHAAITADRNRTAGISIASSGMRTAKPTAGVPPRIPERDRKTYGRVQAEVPRPPEAYDREPATF